MQAATVTLNCLVHEDELAFTRILTVPISPNETIGELRETIWKKKPGLKPALDADRLTLYAPKTLISTASEEEFNDAIKQLNLGTPDGQNSALEKLNPTRKVAKYNGLSNPLDEVLHIIVLLPPGKYQRPLFHICHCTDCVASFTLPFHLIVCGRIMAIPSLLSFPWLVYPLSYCVSSLCHVLPSCSFSFPASRDRFVFAL